MELNKRVHTNFPASHWCPGTGAEKKIPKSLCLKAAEASQQTLRCKKRKKGGEGNHTPQASPTPIFNFTQTPGKNYFCCQSSKTR